MARTGVLAMSMLAVTLLSPVSGTTLFSRTKSVPTVHKSFEETAESARAQQLLLTSATSSDCEINKASTGCIPPKTRDGALTKAWAHPLPEPYVPPMDLYLFWGESSVRGTVASALIGGSGRASSGERVRQILRFGAFNGNHYEDDPSGHGHFLHSWESGQFAQLSRKCCSTVVVPPMENDLPIYADQDVISRRIRNFVANGNMLVMTGGGDFILELTFCAFLTKLNFGIRRLFIDSVSQQLLSYGTEEGFAPVRLLKGDASQTVFEEGPFEKLPGQYLPSNIAEVAKALPTTLSQSGLSVTSVRKSSLPHGAKLIYTTPSSTPVFELTFCQRALSLDECKKAASEGLPCVQDIKPSECTSCTSCQGKCSCGTILYIGFDFVDNHVSRIGRSVWDNVLRAAADTPRIGRPGPGMFTESIPDASYSPAPPGNCENACSSNQPAPVPPQGVQPYAGAPARPPSPPVGGAPSWSPQQAPPPAAAPSWGVQPPAPWSPQQAPPPAAAPSWGVQPPPGWGPPQAPQPAAAPPWGVQPPQAPPAAVAPPWGVQPAAPAAAPTWSPQQAPPPAAAPSWGVPPSAPLSPQQAPPASGNQPPQPPAAPAWVPEQQPAAPTQPWAPQVPQPPGKGQWSPPAQPPVAPGFPPQASIPVPPMPPVQAPQGQYYSQCIPTQQESAKQFTICVFKSDGGMGAIPKIAQADSGNGLHFVGKGTLSVINLNNPGQFRAAVPGTPDVNFAWAIYGSLVIGTTGSYTLCITSDDGSKLYLDGSLMVDDDGLHGMVERCGARILQPGPHIVYIEGFQAGGGVGMITTYSGPDTGDQKVLMKSGTVASNSPYFNQCNPTQQGSSKQFTICIFKSDGGMGAIPKISQADSGNGLHFVGKGTLSDINLNNPGQFRAAVPGTPDVNFAWAIYGSLVIGIPGTYTLCITSDDGSKLYLDGPLIVDDDGLHGMVERCGAKYLQPGAHIVYIEGFQAGGGVGMITTYSGPDTGDKKILMKSGQAQGGAGTYRPFVRCDPSQAGDSPDFNICLFRSEVGLDRIPSFAKADTGENRLYFVKKSKVAVVDFHNGRAFRVFAPSLPRSNYAWIIYGSLNIGMPGTYTLCISSDDGSRLYLDGPLLADDDGLHGMVEKCGTKDLTAGPHAVYIEGFQAGGGVGMEAKYSGPDTGNQMIFMRSGIVGSSKPTTREFYPRCDPTKPNLNPSRFRMCVFRSEVGLSTIPAFGQADTGANRLYFVGRGCLPVVDLNSLDDFRKVVRNTPSSNYAWAIFGQLKVVSAGSYSLCIESDDGSKLSLDGEWLVDNEGLHGMVDKCGTKYLATGDHTVYITGFQAGGGVGMVARYSGPDTGGQKKLIRSGTAPKGGAVVQSGGVAPKYFTRCDPTQGGDSQDFNICLFRSDVEMGTLPPFHKADTTEARLFFLKRSKIAVVDFHEWRALRAFAPSLPQSNYAWVIYGSLVIGTPGSYTLCISSDDGSKLYVDGGLLVDDDGLHGMVEKCGTKDLNAGPHAVYMEGFQAGGGVGMEAKYSGPDTGNQKIFMRSGVVGSAKPTSRDYYRRCNPTRANLDPSRFHMCMFRSEVGLTTIPAFGQADTGANRLYFVGRGCLPVVDLHDLDSFRQVVRSTPDANYAWAIYGQLKIGIAGSYNLCVESDDGSRLSVDGEIVADNEGLHGMVDRCGAKSLSAGDHTLYITGFQAGGGVGMVARYSGPDTNGEKKLIRSGTVEKGKVVAVTPGVAPKYSQRCDPSQTAAPNEFTICLFRSDVGLGGVPSFNKADSGENRLYFLKKNKLAVVDMHDYRAFQAYARTLPTENYAWVIYGNLVIGTAGSYDLCISSDDGSKLYVDGAQLVNDDGLHGMVEKCGTKTLSAGAHPVYMEGFQAGGGVGMEATYSGPDTGNKKIFMRSGIVGSASPPARDYYRRCDPARASQDPTRFRMCVFRSEVGLSTIPSFGLADTGANRLYFVGRGCLPVVDLHSLDEFRKVVRSTPDANYAWAIYGQLKIGVAGSYSLCIESDDGSKLRLDGEWLVDNEGLHGMVDKCGSRYLNAGDHILYITGFQAGGGVGMVARYSGPDTGNQKKLIRSGIAEKAPAAPQAPAPKYAQRCDPAVYPADANEFTICMFRSDVGLGNVPAFNKADSGENKLYFLKRNKLAVVDMHDYRAFQAYARTLPTENYAWVIYGNLVIGTAGSYELCISSDDGSKLYVDGGLLVDDDGLHGMVEKCGTKGLSAGSHPVYMEGFQAGGGVGMEAKYSGPDTGNKKIFMRSGIVGSVSPVARDYYRRCDPARASQDPSRFRMCVFRSEVGLGSIPAFGLADTGVNRLYFVGRGCLPVVDLHSLDEFRKVVRSTPDANYAWAIYGQLKIGITGSYSLCIESDDGSKLRVDGEWLVDNEGLHGMVEKCGTRYLNAGDHILYITGFQAGGGVGMVARYSGPDTGGQKKLIRSGNAEKPPTAAAPPAPKYYSRCDPASQPADATEFTICLFRSDVGLGTIPAFGRADSGENRLYFLKKNKLAVVDMHDYRAFQAYARTLPTENYAWVIYGNLRIANSGNYDLCISSDDGSKLYVDGAQLVDDDGLHGMVEKCGTKGLSAGIHPVYMEGFQAGGGVGMEAMYSGPDTGYKKIYMRSGVVGSANPGGGRYYRRCDPNRPLGDPARFHVCVFRSEVGLSAIPSFGLADTGANRLYFVGKGCLPTVNVRGTGDFRVAVPSTPDVNYAWAISGIIQIGIAGSYTLCIESDDGSRLTVDGDLLVNNEGLHGMVEKCGTRRLAVGGHTVYIDGFQAGGGVGMVATYYGPDTADEKRLLRPGVVGSAPRYFRRCDPSRPAAAEDAAGGSGGFTMCVFRSEVGMDRVPVFAQADTGDNRLYYVGRRRLAVVDMHDLRDFRSYVPDTPRENYAWVIYGSLTVANPGTYSLCISSDDGSKLFVDGSRLVDDDGLHGMVEKCGGISLSAGGHDLYIEGFQRGGGVGMEATYSGPDTGNKKIFIRAADPSAPADPAASPYFRRCDPTAGGDWDASRFQVCVFRSEVGIGGIPAINQADTGTNRLYYVGRGTLPVINLHSAQDFRAAVPGTPDVNFAWAMYARVMINSAGAYTFCITSDDGSKLSIDGAQVVDNLGMHGMVERCGARTLPPGPHTLYVEGCQGGGGVGMEIKYSGPDTDGDKVFVLPGRASSRYHPGCDPTAPGALAGAAADAFTVCMFRSASFQGSVPRIGDAVAAGTLVYVGRGAMPVVDLHRLEGFRQYVPATPNVDYVWAIYGRLVIASAGTYNLCISSDDGSKLYLDGTLLADDDGLHGMVERCGSRSLVSGDHTLYISGFQAGGGVGMEATYSGPDTGGRKAFIRAGAAGTPSAAPANPPRYYPRCDPAAADLSAGGFRVCVFRSEVPLRSIPQVGLADTGLNRLYLAGKGRMAVVDVHNLDAFRAVAPDMPPVDYAWAIYGQLLVAAGGDYTVCIISDDGSKVWVDGILVADDEGLHGMVEKCGTRSLSSGGHTLYLEGFQAGGGVGMEIKYSGPDTGNRKIMMRAGVAGEGPKPQGIYYAGCDPAAAQAADPSKFKVCVFRSEGDIVRVPDFADADTGRNRLYFVGSGAARTIDFGDLDALRRYVPATPDINYAWAISGQISIAAPGVYNFCITSDDGSRLYIDGAQVADNDGLHGMVERCGAATLAAGAHTAHVVGFQCRGGVGMVTRYSGPDTAGDKILLAAGPPASLYATQCDPNAPDSDAGAGGGFTICTFKSDRQMDRLPRVGDAVAAGWLTYVGRGRVPVVDMHTGDAFRQYVKQTPDVQFVWVVYGTVTVTAGGVYTFCISSDDGSKLYVDGALLVDVDGLHGMVERCSPVTLSSGPHKVYLAGFQNHGGLGQELRYQGPDTVGARVFLRAGVRGSAIMRAAGAAAARSALRRRGGGEHRQERLASDGGSALLRSIYDLTRQLRSQSHEVEDLRARLDRDDGKTRRYSQVVGGASRRGSDDEADGPSSFSESGSDGALPRRRRSRGRRVRRDRADGEGEGRGRGRLAVGDYSE